MGRGFPRALTWAAFAAPVFFLLAAGDLALRSRAALEEGRRQEAWLADPAAKAAWYGAEFERARKGTEADTAAGKLSPEEASRRIALLETERDFRVSESSAKLAYLWYRTAASQFRSPLNPWAREAAGRLPAALAAWKAELEAKGIKPEPWMIE